MKCIIKKGRGQRLPNDAALKPHTVLIERGLGPKSRGIPQSVRLANQGVSKEGETKPPKNQKSRDNGAAGRFISGYREYMARAAQKFQKFPHRTERHSINADWDMMNCRQANKNTFFGSSKTKEIPREFMQMIYALSRIRNNGLPRLGRLAKCSFSSDLSLVGSLK